MRVRTRLVVTFALLAAVLLVPALYAASKLNDLREFAVEGRTAHAQAVATVRNIGDAVSELERAQRGVVSVPDPALAMNEEEADESRSLRRDFLQDVAEARGRLARHLDALRDSRYGAAAAVARPMADTLEARSRRVEELVAEGRMDRAEDAVLGMGPRFLEMQLRLEALTDTVDVIAARDFQRTSEIIERARTGTLVSLAAVILLALVIAGWTTRALTHPLRQVAGATGRVAEGSYRAPDDLPYDREDEIGELARAFRAMTERLDELDRLKAEFVGVASHELKTPINVIRGYTELIEENLAGDVTEDQAQILGAIAEQTRTMSRLVSRLMDISRLETGTYRMEIEEVHTEDVVTGVLRSFDILADEKGVELVVERHPSTPEIIAVDVDLVRDEVLGNLVSNALKHTPEGGRIRLGVSGDGSDVVFEVSDTGPGIPRDEREHIFEKYYQVHRSRKVGTGLGLAVAREMVEAHGGRIELAPDVSEGATFRVYLPVQPTEVREPSLRAPRPERGVAV